jgi:hypothetical protein
MRYYLGAIALTSLAASLVSWIAVSEPAKPGLE